MKVELIYGPPGTGKTSTLLEILSEELLTKYQPNEIAYVSYTRKGSYEGRDRAIDKFGLKAKDFPYFKTLHSIAFSSLKLQRHQMIDKSNYKHFSDKVGMKFTGYYTEEFNHTDDAYLFFDILHRNNPKAASAYLPDLDVEVLKYIRTNYKAFKKAYKVYDFTDIIEMYVENNEALPGVKAVIIDEAQDLTYLQWKMIWVAFKNVDICYIAGDDDQAIYEWAGADVKYFLHLEGNKRILNKSYRLPEHLIDFSKKITSQISERIDKHFVSANDKGGSVQFINSLLEVPIKPKETYLFLSRNVAFLKGIEDYLKALPKVFVNKGVRSIENTEVAAIKDFCKLKESKNERHMTNALRLHKKGDKEFNLRKEWYDNMKWEPEKVMYYRDLIRTKTNIQDTSIELSTIHAVKGGEADNVILLSDISRNVKKNVDNNPDSEHRVFYVGATRAKKQLYVVNSQTKYEYKFY